LSTSNESASLKPIWYQIGTNLSFYVLISITIGIALGYFYPAEAVKMEILGKTFVDIIKLFIIPIIFLTIVLGISSIGDLKKVGRIGIKSLLYFEIVTTLALAIGIIIAIWLEPGKIDRTGLLIQDASKFTKQAGSSFNWLQFFKANSTLQVLCLAILVGIILNYSTYRLKAVHILGKISHYVFTAFKWVMYLAPVGAFGGMAFTIGKFGLKTLIPLAKLMGCSKSVVGLVIPTGYSFNLDGTSIYLSMAAIFLAQLYNVSLSPSELGMMLLILMITSKGAAGVTGSGFIVLASTLAALHRIPLEGLAFLLGVDKFMSEARAITNLIGNGVATLVIAKSENEWVKP